MSSVYIKIRKLFKIFKKFNKYDKIMYIINKELEMEIIWEQ